MKYLSIILFTLLIASCTIKVNEQPTPKLTCSDNFEFDQFIQMVGEKKEDVLYILKQYGEGTPIKPTNSFYISIVLNLKKRNQKCRSKYEISYRVIEEKIKLALPLTFSIALSELVSHAVSSIPRIIPSLSYIS